MNMRTSNVTTCIKCGVMSEPYLTWIAPHTMEMRKGTAFTGECLIAECPTCGFPTKQETADQQKKIDINIDSGWGRNT